jgi:hypothetical protein
LAKLDPPVRWAPRVRPEAIRRLYARDAQGLLDEELLDEVGYALYSRCRSILHVSDAMNGKVHCPSCDTIVVRETDRTDALLCCSGCGWEARWGDYSATYRTQELGAGGAWDIFQEFVRQWEQVRAPREKMVLIDRLIHQWHWETRAQRPKFGLGRPTGLNLIEGNKHQVLAFLDSLTYGSGSTVGTQATKAAWRARWLEVTERDAASRAAARLKRASRDDEEARS